MRAVDEATCGPAESHTPERAAAMAYLQALHANIGICVWAPRPVPHQRGSSRMLYYNDAFLQLCDTSVLRNGEMQRVIPQQLVFLSEEARHQTRASMERIFCMVDALHMGQANHTTAQVIHISLVGRLQYVHMEIIGLRRDGKLRELIFGELPLPAGHTLSADLQVPYGIVDERFLFDYTLPFAEEVADDAPTEKTPPPTVVVGKAKKRQFRWTHIPENDLISTKKKEPKRVSMRNFRCAECKTTQTTQRRRAPDGSLTLCNKCGLKWKRTTIGDAMVATPS